MTDGEKVLRDIKPILLSDDFSIEDYGYIINKISGNMYIKKVIKTAEYLIFKKFAELPISADECNKIANFFVDSLKQTEEEKVDVCNKFSREAQEVLYTFSKIMRDIHHELFEDEDKDNLCHILARLVFGLHTDDDYYTWEVELDYYTWWHEI